MSYGYETGGRFNRVWIGSVSGGADFTYAYKSNSNFLDHLDGPRIDPYYTYECNRDVLTKVHNKIGVISKSAYSYTTNALARRTEVDTTGAVVASVKYTLDVDEVRVVSALRRNGTPPSRVALAEEAPVSLQECAIMIIHMIPVQTFITSETIDLDGAYEYISNADFRKWRQVIGRGGDFEVYSDVEVHDVDDKIFLE